MSSSCFYNWERANNKCREREGDFEGLPHGRTWTHLAEPGYVLWEERVALHQPVGPRAHLSLAPAWSSGQAPGNLSAHQAVSGCCLLQAIGVTGDFWLGQSRVPRSPGASPGSLCPDLLTMTLTLLPTYPSTPGIFTHSLHA